MAKKSDSNSDVNIDLQKEISKSRFGDMLELVENITDMSVSCASTGFPQLDTILHSDLRGLPLGRDIEIMSKNPECGKTSLALQILQAWQAAGKRTLFFDIERTVTPEYLQQLGILLTTDDANIPALRVSRPKDLLSAEEILDAIGSSSHIFDLIVIDSLGAMDIKANLEKNSDEPNKIGAMALLMSNFLKKNVNKRATIIWINQMRQVVGGYNPTGNIRYSSMCGRALMFYASMRIELSVIEKLTDADKEVYGYRVKAYTEKNKLSPQYRSCELTYMMGEGFSNAYDYLNLALKLGIVEKSGSWFNLPSGERFQGELTCYEAIRDNKSLLNDLKKAIEEKQKVE